MPYYNYQSYFSPLQDIYSLYIFTKVYLAEEIGGYGVAILEFITAP